MATHQLYLGDLTKASYFVYCDASDFFLLLFLPDLFVSDLFIFFSNHILARVKSLIQRKS